MADCTIIGEVQNIAGTGRAKVGTYLTIQESRLPNDEAHAAGSSQTLDFVVGSDGTLKLKTDPTVAAKVAQGSSIRFRGPVYGFEAGTKWVTIPNTATVDINVLAANASASSPVATSVAQSVFNAHTELIAGPATLGHVMVPAENIDEDGLLIFSESGGAWGTITGTLSDQTDLAAALAAKASLVGGTVPDNQIPASIARDTEVSAAVTAERTAVATLTNKTLTSPAIASPTGLTKSDVGLGNVDNTSDLLKPIGTATQTALDAKVNAAFSGYTEKATPVDADMLIVNDSAASGAVKWLSWANLKATLKTYFDTLYQAVSANLTALSALLIAGSNTIEQRNGTNAQAFRVYGSYTDASNYIRGSISMSSNEMIVRTERAGTGTALNYLSLFGGSGGVQLGINGATSWLVHPSGHLLANSDSTYRLGDATHRPSETWGVKFCYATNVCDFAGAGTPEGSVAASVGSTYRRTDGGAGTTFYVKESGSNTNTGWVAK